ncbi:MAG TPA: phosphoribosyltransferase family protein [Polyangiaceae bacterium]
MVRFLDRRDAGRRLAAALRSEVSPDVVVMGLARGGVPVAYEVARKLRAPLDVLVVRKLGVPGHEELAMGAIGPGGERVLNEEVLRLTHVSPSLVDHVAMREQREAERRERTYRRGRQPEDVRGRHVVVVDDGLATGASMRAAVASLRKQGARRITVAVPVGSPGACEDLQADADEVLCLTSPDWLFAIGPFYEDFSPTSDEEVSALLSQGQPWSSTTKSAS